MYDRQSLYFDCVGAPFLISDLRYLDFYFQVEPYSKVLNQNIISKIISIKLCGSSSGNSSVKFLMIIPCIN